MKANMRGMLTTFLNECRIKEADQLFRSSRLDQLLVDLAERKASLKMITVSLFRKFFVSGQVNKVVSTTHTEKKDHQVFEKFGFGLVYYGNLLYRCTDKVIDLVKKHLCFVLVCT